MILEMRGWQERIPQEEEFQELRSSLCILRILGIKTRSSGNIGSEPGAKVLEKRGGMSWCLIRGKNGAEQWIVCSVWASPTAVTLFLEEVSVNLVFKNVH